MVRGLGSGRIRVTRVTTAIESAHTIEIERIGRKPRIVEARDIRADLSNLRKVCAIVALATLYQETALIS